MEKAHQKKISRERSWAKVHFKEKWWAHQSTKTYSTKITTLKTRSLAVISKTIRLSTLVSWVISKCQGVIDGLKLKNAGTVKNMHTLSSSAANQSATNTSSNQEQKTDAKSKRQLNRSNKFRKKTLKIWKVITKKSNARAKVSTSIAMSRIQVAMLMNATMMLMKKWVRNRKETTTEICNLQVWQPAGKPNRWYQ